MNNYNYFRLTKFKKIRYLKRSQKNSVYIVFLHGFMSDLEGKKPQTFFKFARKNKLGFLSLEYSGHGKSSGVFTKGNISIWTSDTKRIIKKIIKKKNFILIGSSMGSWIAINQFKYFKSQIKGFVGIGSAPEFLTRLMWNKFPMKTKKELLKTGKVLIKNGEYEYPITLQLIKDGKKNKVLDKKVNSSIRITMIHGQKDEVVPTIFSKYVLKVFSKAKKKIVIIKDGDHSLSNQDQLRKIIKELNIIVKNII